MDEHYRTSAVVKTILLKLDRENNGVADYESLAGDLKIYGSDLEDPSCIPEPSLNALWGFADAYFDARQHGFPDLDGIPWNEARMILVAAVAKIEAGEPVTDLRVLRYRSRHLKHFD